jgi:dTDP-4-amino-4,6-dideoxygalactose transaminase
MTTTVTQLEVPFVDLKAQYGAIREEVLDRVTRVLDSGHFIGGEHVESFEEEFAEFTGARYAIGVSSGTAALELALKASGVTSGDEVIVPANSFFATAEAVSNVGAAPVFGDVDPVTFHLDMDDLERRIGPRTRAVIPVHLYGRAMDLTRLAEICAHRNVSIIEDAAQAHGTAINGIKTGSSNRPTCFSFYPGKNLGAYGDAGAITCNDLQMANELRLLRDHGSPSKYQHSAIGMNGRLDAIQAAVLSVKLPHLQYWNSLRAQHAKAYSELLAGCAVKAPHIPNSGTHNFHLFIVRVEGRDQVKADLAKSGVQTGIHYPVPLHLTTAYQKLGYPSVGSLPVAEKLASEILSLPMFPELAQEQIEHVINTLREICG